MNNTKTNNVGERGQAKMILKHLKTKKTITSMEAFELYGATRLSSHIFAFRKAGYDIRNQWVETENRYGENCRYVKYIYKGRL